MKQENAAPGGARKIGSRRPRKHVLALTAALVAVLLCAFACDAAEKKREFRCKEDYYENKDSGMCVPESLLDAGGQADATSAGDGGTAAADRLPRAAPPSLAPLR